MRGSLLSYGWRRPETEFAGLGTKRNGREETVAEECAAASGGHSEEGQNASAQRLDASR